MNNLLKPYPGINLSLFKTNFNKRISVARRCVECTFGILTMKWRILLTTIYQEPKTVNQMIKCMCVLHNVIIDSEGEGKSLAELANNQNQARRLEKQNDNHEIHGLGKIIRAEMGKWLYENQ